MKVKTSVTLSKDLVQEMDRRARQYKNRSAFIEAAVTALLHDLARQEQDARDLQVLDQHVDRLNREAADVLAFQVPL
jgi:Arc/MetJ-type ribon-helix-helix transcriptional regulator